MKITLSYISRSAAIVAFTLVSAEAQLAGQLGVLDVTANNGINPATGVAWAEGDQYRLIFLSSTTTDALSPDIATYNSFVQATAAASTTFLSLGDGTWNLLGSTLTVDARDNTGTNPSVEAGIPIFLMDGSSLLATNNSELWRAPSAVAVILDENGVEVDNPSTRVFTGSFNTGIGVGAGSGGGANGDGAGSGDTALGVLDGQGVQTGQPFHTANPGRELDFWLREWKEPAANSLPVYAISEPLAVVDAEPFTITVTSIAFDPETSQLSLVWNSRLDDVYVVNYSSDLVDWSGQVNVIDVASEGTETSSVFDLSGLDISTSGPIFFRVDLAPDGAGNQ